MCNRESMLMNKEILRDIWQCLDKSILTCLVNVYQCQYAFLSFTNKNMKTVEGNFYATNCHQPQWNGLD